MFCDVFTLALMWTPILASGKRGMAPIQKHLHGLSTTAQSSHPGSRMLFFTNICRNTPTWTMAACTSMSLEMPLFRPAIISISILVRTAIAVVSARLPTNRRNDARRTENGYSLRCRRDWEPGGFQRLRQPDYTG